MSFSIISITNKQITIVIFFSIFFIKTSHCHQFSKFSAFISNLVMWREYFKLRSGFAHHLRLTPPDLGCPVNLAFEKALTFVTGVWKCSAGSMFKWNMKSSKKKELSGIPEYCNHLKIQVIVIYLEWLKMLGFHKMFRKSMLSSCIFCFNLTRKQQIVQRYFSFIS